MPYNFTTSFKMWAIYHSKPFASAAGNYEGHLSMLLKKKGELNIKCNECSDYIADAESYLARRERKKSYLQIEQTHVTSGTPRAKTISLEITVANRTIRKFQKRAEKARQVRVKGEQYSKYTTFYIKTLFFFFLKEEQC